MWWLQCCPPPVIGWAVHCAQKYGGLCGGWKTRRGAFEIYTSLRSVVLMWPRRMRPPQEHPRPQEPNLQPWKQRLCHQHSDKTNSNRPKAITRKQSPSSHTLISGLTQANPFIHQGWVDNIHFSILMNQYQFDSYSTERTWTNHFFFFTTNYRTNETWMNIRRY